MRNKKLLVLVECALLIAVSAVLCEFPKFKFLENGGSITFCSMLPIILISYIYGIKWGMMSSTVFALIQIFTGFSGPGTTAVAFIVVLLFDYLLAFAVLGFGGMFKGKFNNVRLELTAGAAVVIALRFVCHFISGVAVWGEYAEWFFENMGNMGNAILRSCSGFGLSCVYSAIYNGSFMLPELIITCVVAYLAGPAIIDIQKKIVKE